jgi:hypothetical protein
LRVASRAAIQVEAGAEPIDDVLNLRERIQALHESLEFGGRDAPDRPWRLRWTVAGSWIGLRKQCAGEREQCD